MESWSYVTEEEKGFASDEAISATDAIGCIKLKSGIIGWESKSPYSYSYGKNMVVVSSSSSQQEASKNKNQEFMELGFQDMSRKSLPSSNSISDVLSSITNQQKNEESSSTKSSSKLSSSVVESSNGRRDLSSLFDLKLGSRFSDQREVQNPNSNSVKQSLSPSPPTPNLSSAESYIMPPAAKRVKVTGFISQTPPFCQVHGCKKDLTSSKDYHKRHKVCEVHSKTAKVIVNGIEQRFCQQCSRFHLLAEFDDGKRSCRKRLAGHNERRRKPHGIHSGRTGRLFQSYNGSVGGRFQGTLPTSSFICQDILPSNLLLPQNYETHDWYRHIKHEDGADYSPQSATPIRYDHLHPKSIFPSYDFEKHCHSFQENGVNSATGSNLNENNNRFALDLAGSISASRCFFQNTSMGNQDFPIFDAASTVQGLSEMSGSGRALSLLSSQSQSSRYCVSKVPENLLGVSPKGSTSGPGGVSNNFHTPEMNSAVENHVGPILISDDNDALGFGIANGIFQGSGYVNAKDHLSCEHEPTIDLLQLSSQLQRVEHQRHSTQVKHENDAFSGLRFT